VNIVLISTYELGRQPFGLASPAAWLREAGHSVTCLDLAISALASGPIREAQIVAFYLPMHTATRLAAKAIEKIKGLNPSVRLICYGLYAPVNAEYLRGLGVDSIIGGEFEAALADAVEKPRPEPLVSLDRIQFRVPDRTGLPSLARYAGLRLNGSKKKVGYTEASRGCKHLCRHCPVVPVYNGTFRVVPADVVMEDVRRQVGSGAEHITFGDPDFFNGPRHAMRIAHALHGEFPNITYDATIKIEHLLLHRALLPELRDTGCLFVTSAVESIDNGILERLAKGHTRADFIRVACDFRELGLTLAPTFIPFTPWTTREGYQELLRVLVDLDLIENVAPVQLALRLLITSGSRLLELPEIRRVLEPFDRKLLIHPWRHPDPSIDALSAELLNLVAEEQKQQRSRTEIFGRIWERAYDRRMPDDQDRVPRAAIPYMDEPWYC
jgi:radical SAM superfamily enzyme YgiQ (UPF0313 family)